MKLSEVPAYPAYLVFHDAFMKGAMDVYPCDAESTAQFIANRRNDNLDASGNDDSGFWAAYTKLPRKKVWKFHVEKFYTAVYVADLESQVRE